MAANESSAVPPASPLVDILKEELRRQRTFLSSDEEVALTRPLTYDNEDDLAFDRLKGRRHWFQPVLRNRFIRDGRPIAEWREYIAAEEAAAGGEPTIISSLATGVLEWTARTTDRGAMLGGFAAKTLSFFALVLLLLGAYSWTHDAAIPGAVVIVLALLVYAGGHMLGAMAKRRTADRTRQLLVGPSPTRLDGVKPAAAEPATVPPQDTGP